MNQEELHALPHGPEFQFIQEITFLDPGVSAVGVYQISGNEAFLPGHFPKKPMWPGVMMVEAIAQLGGVAAQSSPHHDRLNDMRLTAIKNAKILGSAKPGAILEIKVKVEGRMGSLIQISGTVSELRKVDEARGAGDQNQAGGLREDAKSSNQQRTLLTKAIVMLSGS